jgi:hypothetical protein
MSFFRFIPTESQNVASVEAAIRRQFEKDGVLHFYILGHLATGFDAKVFFCWDRQIAEAEASGLSARIAEKIHEGLRRVGLTLDGAAATVVFEFDSDERVKRHFEGSYYLRLRDELR